MFAIMNSPGVPYNIPSWYTAAAFSGTPAESGVLPVQVFNSLLVKTCKL
jgi:hypothetical protein